MKKSIFPRLLIGLLVVTLFAGCLFAGTTTLAMYRAQATGTGNASIARFDVQLNDKGMVSGMTAYEAQAFNLFSTIYEWDAPHAADGTGTAGQPDAQVATGKIAPGTAGELAIKVTNRSDVAIKYAIKVETASNFASYTYKPTLQFSIDGGNSWGAVLGSDLFTGELAVGSTTPQEATKTLLWRWVFRDGSAAATDGSWSLFGDDAGFDTPVGIAAGMAGYPVNVSVTATQID